MRLVSLSLFLSISLLNPLAADELPCPVTGGTNVLVSGDDTVSGNCSISAELSGGSNTAGPVSSVTVTDTGSLELGLAASLRNHGQLATDSGGELTSLGILNNGNSPTAYNNAQGGPPAGVIQNAGLLTNNGQLTNHNGFRVIQESNGAVLFEVDQSVIFNSGELVNNGTLTNGTAASLGGPCFVFCYQESRARINNTGHISNTSGATFVNAGDIINTGHISNAYGATFNNSGSIGGTFGNPGIFDNAGQLNLIGANSSVGGTLNNLATGVITSNGALSRQINNDGSVVNAGGEAYAALSGTGSFSQTGASGRSYVFGDTTIQQGSVSIWDGVFLGDGRVEAGNFAIGANARLEVGSRIAQWDSQCSEGGFCDSAEGAGQLEVLGDMLLVGALVLRTGPDGYSSLWVDGALNLAGGALRFNYDIDSEGYEFYDYDIGAGSVFDLVTATSISGDFGSVSLALLENGLSWRTELVTEGGVDIFRATVVPIPPAILLFGSALALMGVWRRRRQ